MYVSTEISKHKYSLYLSIRDLAIKYWLKVMDRLEPRMHIIFKVFKMTIRIVVLIVFSRVIFIGLREYF